MRSTRRKRTISARLCVIPVALAGSAACIAAEPRWEAPIEIAAGPGVKGPWRQNDSRYDYVDDPSVALSPRGELALVWVDQATKDVFFRSAAGAVRNVSASPETFSWLPRVAFDPHHAGRVHVLWQEIIFSGGSHGGDILFATSGDGGASFSAPLNLSRSVGGDGKGRIDRHTWDNGSLDLAVGADGVIYAAWTDYEGGLYLSVSGDVGRTFSAPRQVAGDPARPARAPSLAIGADRALYLAWTHGEDPSADVRVARSVDGGVSFQAPVLAAVTEAFSDAPKLAADRRGVLHLAFADGDRILYTRSDNGARSFAPPTLLARGGGSPSIDVDQAANVCVLWERLAARRPRGLAYAVSRDEGRSFGRPAEVPGSAAPDGGKNGSQQGLLTRKLALGPEGSLAVVNSTLKPGERSRVWLVRGKL